MPSAYEVAKKKLNALNMTIRRKDGEFRVNFAGGREATAYYSPELQDAIQTAVMMYDRARARLVYANGTLNALIFPLGRGAVQIKRARPRGAGGNSVKTTRKEMFRALRLMRDSGTEVTIVKGTR